MDFITVFSLSEGRNALAGGERPYGLRRTGLSGGTVIFVRLIFYTDNISSENYFWWLHPDFAKNIIISP
jgi:hypothetical protein